MGQLGNVHFGRKGDFVSQPFFPVDADASRDQSLSKRSVKVYESLLDGMELEELRHNAIYVEHCLMIDDHFTWWDCGRSYLCRVIDMLHMGYVDEVLFGYEVVERLPKIVKSWVEILRKSQIK
jgi:hypothetical protein